MSFTEKQSWVLLIAVLGSTALYLSTVLDRPAGQALVETPYMWPMLRAVGATVVLTIIGSIVIAIPAASREGCDEGEFEADERDKDIDRRGEVIGYLVFSVGVLNALVLTLAESAHFWIGNAIYLSGALATMVACVIKLFLYRRGF
jgi:hypothetical protein